MVQLPLGTTQVFWGASNAGEPPWGWVRSVGSIFFISPRDPYPCIEVAGAAAQVPSASPCSPPPSGADQGKPGELGNMAPAQHGPHQGGTTIPSGLCFGEMPITCQSPCASSEVKACHECCWRDTLSQWVINI